MHCVVFVFFACADVMLGYVPGGTLLYEALHLVMFLNTVRNLLLDEACSWMFCVSLLSSYVLCPFQDQVCYRSCASSTDTICRLCHVRCRDCCFNFRD